jgi:regulator of protease activity HflC (stomatin/prohibitin superfamily)
LFSREAFGPGYIDKAVKPEIGSRTREVISRHSAEEVYTKRNLIETEIKASTEATLAAMLKGMGGGEELPTSRRTAGKTGSRCPPKITEINRQNLAKSVILNSTLVAALDGSSAGLM